MTDGSKISDFSRESIRELLNSGKGKQGILFIGRDMDSAAIIDLLGSDTAPDNIYVALSGDGQLSPSRPDYPTGQVLDRSAGDFIDRVKMITREQGFPFVLVADDDPQAVRQALGVAGVLGEIRLFRPPRRMVKADLTATINYKSLRIKS
jgi:hypothetical protein